MALNPQAEELNKIIQENSTIFDILSERGKAIFFPKKGILAQTAEAKGKKINATIGIALEEDGSPMRLKSIAKNIKNIDPKDIFPYASSFGKQELREKWKEMLYEKNPSLKGKEISLPVVTNALTHGLSMCGYMFINPGDKLILTDLFWGNYNLIFKLAYGCEMITFETFKRKSFNTEALRKSLEENPGKQILLLNFPNNPCGYTPTEEEQKEIVNVIKESAEKGNKIVVLTDDAYFGLVYKKGIATESIFSYLADLHENVLAVKLDGATKEDYVWGFRTGFITLGIKGGTKELYSALESKFGGAIRGNISNAPHISQSLVLNAFTSPSYSKEKNKKYNLLKKRFKEVAKVLKEHAEYKEFFEPYPFNSGYFMCVKLKEGIDGEQLRKLLLDKYDTGVIAIGDVIRIAFSAAPTDTIAQLFDNIYNACKQLKNG